MSGYTYSKNLKDTARATLRGTTVKKRGRKSGSMSRFDSLKAARASLAGALDELRGVEIVRSSTEAEQIKAAIRAVRVEQEALGLRVRPLGTSLNC